MVVLLKLPAKRSWSLVVWLSQKTKKRIKKLWMTMVKLSSWLIRLTFWMWPMVLSNVAQISITHLITSTTVEISFPFQIVSTPKVSESTTNTITRLSWTHLPLKNKKKNRKATSSTPTILTPTRKFCTATIWPTESSLKSTKVSSHLELEDNLLILMIEKMR